ncbi:MAG TPA: iron ABC transporter permease [Ignavibacteriales bacterium]|nr:iron ABC transporter permease [Ignavibacteriales bacterium]HOM64573.1 iron ABC transporter permease [Ignavibacteriales bacterium]HPP32483.1 iron ABC transporter permease [Ignavibacteriales bacterium]HRR17550.1 iron ABC transporter permease [Ignavibacteriales bacterium]HRT98039.1 iron ABC transporter permease [Ignavibacteriales bacterium]
MIVSVVLCLGIGSSHIPMMDVLNVLIGKGTEINSTIIYDLRLPRIIIAIAVGGGLAIVGAIFQAIFINPLAEPYILGVSSGAALGTVIGILLGLSMFFINILAFVIALVITGFTFVISKKILTSQNETMLLTGVMLSSFFSAIILILISMAHETARNAYFWLIGNLTLANMNYAFPILFFTVLISFVLSLFGFKLNIMSMGEDYARYTGVNITVVKYFLLILSTVVVAVLVSISGIIGFVGLVVPHFTRLLFGIDNRKVLPYSFIIGAIYLTIADTIGRTILAPAEIPVGAITALLGSPIFIYFLRRKKIN